MFLAFDESQEAIESRLPRALERKLHLTPCARRRGVDLRSQSAVENTGLPAKGTKRTEKFVLWIGACLKISYCRDVRWPVSQLEVAIVYPEDGEICRWLKKVRHVRERRTFFSKMA
jgi:hypothetical protein